ncbi:Gfo/Idh/MocA family oxidoreductase [Ginsengibacter hankyongi]|uniref:Gfo/Idh/MocA family oxidoreductase n=1 Tax=Ginsengibacter hankyongi TaxID=2607284 RepID=A0A5J5IFE8_9BACT|nr:Gfo/Idh/MocA family oxidoreductase [Ginsengibacter hankyongi]KAA9038573.1 Gfo/Idh/MocA family oxidoreductase [Ginsengibacter hankyongi]
MKKKLAGTTIPVTKTLSDNKKPVKDKLGIAIIGLGEYASDELATALKKTKECYLAGIVTDEPSKAKKWKKYFNIPDTNIYDYKNFDRIKDNADIDIIYIVLPNSLHREYAVRAAKAGKHVICEKPMAITVKDCDKMLTAFDKSGTMLSIGYRLHFEPHHIKVMELGQKKYYGNIKRLIAKNGIPEIDGWRLDKELSGGGALMDVGVYCVQAVRYTTGMEPVSVTAKEGKKTSKKKFKEIEESISWQMEMPGGLIAECECSYTKEMSLLRAEAESDWFELSPAFTYSGIKGKTSSGKMNLRNINQQVAQMDDFANAIKNNKPTPVDGETGKQDVKILQAIYKAVKTGKRVIIK